MPPLLLTCPMCGRDLLPVEDNHPDTPPWLCPDDRIGFWQEELTSAARSLFDPHARSWPVTAKATAIRDRVDGERHAARERGSSTIPDHARARRHV